MTKAKLLDYQEQMPAFLCCISNPDPLYQMKKVMNTPKEQDWTSKGYLEMSPIRTCKVYHPPGLRLSISLQKINSLLKNLSQNIKRAQTLLLNCNKSIPQFPQSEWLNVLGSNAVNFDHVFSNLYTT